MITPKINLSIGENCELIVEDLTKYNEDLSYENSVVYNYVIYNKSNKETDGPYIFKRTLNQNKYYFNKVEPIILPLYYDGWITIVHIVLPKGEREGYYFENDSVYFNGSVISDSELLTQALINNSPLNVVNVDFINYCFLERCYIDLCKKLIEGYDCDGCNPSQIETKLIMLKILLRAIKIMVEFEQFEQAQELIEAIMRCNGLCECCSDNIKICNCV